MRVAPLAEQGGRLIVVGGVQHRDWIVEQLAEMNVVAQILLEPEARDSAPAMAAAAAWIHRHDPEGVMAVVASDHHVPDHESFRQAVRDAAKGARDGQIVTLGVKPTEPSSAYGYIKRRGDGLTPVEAFREKPDASTASLYIEEGYLWNSGNFIVAASVLIDELRLRAAQVMEAIDRALPPVSCAGIQVLGGSFGQAPKISIDYAVMEKTERASVLGVDFSWSDLGAWDSIASSGEGQTGSQILEDAEGCLVRAPDGVLVAAVGVRNLAIVVEPDAILVCDLSRAQDVKKVVERLRSLSPRHLDFPRSASPSLNQEALRFGRWLNQRALPVWCTLGLGDEGAFAEMLTLEGRPVSVPRRARVQTRQIYVYAQAGMLGWSGPWRRVVASGLDVLFRQYLRDDGLCRALLSHDGESLDDQAMLYDQAFVLLALATARMAGIDRSDLEERAVLLRDRLINDALPNGAMLAGGSHPYQANAHMHLLEACLAWEEAGGDGEWGRLADRVVRLAQTTFIDPDEGYLREFFDADWQPTAGEDGTLIEPGHQFEWAWLFVRHARLRGLTGNPEVALRLYAAGRRGVGERSRVAVDALNDDYTIRSDRARLWPQTEWLKSALILSEHDAEIRDAMLADAQAALSALWLYLTPDGLWHDKRLPDQTFLDEPAPASSLYHIVAAFRQVRDTVSIVTTATNASAMG